MVWWIIVTRWIGWFWKQSTRVAKVGPKLNRVQLSMHTPNSHLDTLPYWLFEIRFAMAVQYHTIKGQKEGSFYQNEFYLLPNILRT